MARIPKSVSMFMHEHKEQCARRAFPQSGRQYDDAEKFLAGLETELAKQSASFRRSLGDSGIAGTSIQYPFSYDVARWLARKAPKSVFIDWPELENHDALDALLHAILLPGEDEYFDSGYVSTREWLTKASVAHDGTDFDWLMAQLQDTRLQPFFRELYDNAEIPLKWELRQNQFSKSNNSVPQRKPVIRDNGFRGRPAQVKKEIAKPVENISRLSKSRGVEMIDVAIASLATRHRETLHFNFANPDEVYVADVGMGIAIAVFGLLPEHRFSLECTMGYLILSNGVPIGYGGASMLFKQANTGVNLFDEYRGTEAAFLWVQVMRVYHSLFRCTRYVANPYQLGADNSEALGSGAFWFYYRLGYRPVDVEIRQLAAREQAKCSRRSGYRCSIKILKRLASGDMHLTLPTARQNEFFDEEWLVTSSALVTELLGQAGGKTRQDAARRAVKRLRTDIGIGNLGSWTKGERSLLAAIAPFVAILNPSDWKTTEKRETRKLLQAKGGKYELPFARALQANEKFLQALRAACKRAEADH